MQILLGCIKKELRYFLKVSLYCLAFVSHNKYDKRDAILASFVLLMWYEKRHFLRRDAKQ